MAVTKCTVFRRTTFALAVLLLSSSCSARTSWVDELMTEATAPEEIDAEMEQFLAEVTATGEAGGCFGGIMEEPGPGDPVPPSDSPEVSSGTGNDPYTATGARQVPGPNMTKSAAPEEPIYRIVARPADPNEHDPAGKPEGGATGPMPEPRIITSTSPTTTLPDVAAPDPGEDPAVQCG